jgi:hypothetical protein
MAHASLRLHVQNGYGLSDSWASLTSHGVMAIPILQLKDGNSIPRVLSLVHVCQNIADCDVSSLLEPVLLGSRNLDSLTWTRDLCKWSKQPSSRATDISTARRCMVTNKRSALPSRRMGSQEAISSSLLKWLTGSTTSRRPPATVRRSCDLNMSTCKFRPDLPRSPKEADV